MKSLLIGSLFGSALAVVTFTNMDISSGVESNIHEYMNEAPITFEDLSEIESVVMMDEVVIRGSGKVLKPVVSEKSKEYKCKQWRDSLVGGFVRECEWR